MSKTGSGMGDFYAKQDAKYDKWLDQGQRNMANSLPHELTALEPEYRAVYWKDDAYPSRETQRRVHPEVAAEAERLDAICRPSLEECTKVEFSPSRLSVWRAGWGYGKVEALHEQNEAFVSLEHSVLRKAVLREGAGYALKLLDQVISTLEETSCKSVKKTGRCLRPAGHTLPHGNGVDDWPLEDEK